MLDDVLKYLGGHNEDIMLLKLVLPPITIPQVDAQRATETLDA